MLVLFSNRYNESEVCLDQFFLGTLTLTTAFANLLGQLNLLINRDHRFSTNLHQVLVECFTGTIGYTLANLKLSHKYPFTFLFLNPIYTVGIHLYGFGLQRYKKKRNLVVIEMENFCIICLFFRNLDVFEYKNGIW